MNPLNEYPFFHGDKPRIIGHRGAAGEAPENTLVSFQRAVRDGAQFIELDVRGSRDGEVMVIHDATVKRTTNGSGAVSKQNLKDLEALDAGYRFSRDGGKSYPYRGQDIRIPTLKEIFDALPRTRFIVEIKQARPSIVKRVFEEVRRAGKEEAVLLATDWGWISMSRRASPQSQPRSGAAT